MMRWAAFIVLLCTAQANAQEVLPCDYRAEVDAIVEPWEDNSRSFANGDVRVALLDTIEPAAAAYYLLILSPPLDELGARQCRMVGFGGGVGFASLDIAALRSSYDPARGLILRLPGRIYDVESDFSNAAELRVTIRQATGDITPQLTLGRE